MGGRIDYAPVPTPLARAKTPYAVFRNDGSGNYVYLPNIIAETVQTRFGASPAVCLCRYTADGYDDESGYPVRLDDSMPLDSVGPYVVRPDDRLAVVVFDSMGNGRPIFDGFAKIPEAALTASTERVSFQAINVAEREWDNPLQGSLWRDAPQRYENDKITHLGLPARFNPDGKANATPAGADFQFSDDPTGFQFPLFLDQFVCAALKTGRKWSLSMAARYVMAVGNTYQTYVQMPDWSVVDQLLDSWTPTQGDTLDPTNPATYTANPIIIRDITVSGKAWPAALDELIRPHGFAMRFETSPGQLGDPVTRVVLWKRDTGDGLRYKDMLLPEPDSDLDPAATNLGSCHFARDTAQVANAVMVEAAPLKHEATFILAPGWRPDPADAANKANFRKANNPAFNQFRKMYRWFIFDETGEGHWDWTSSAWVENTGTSLTTVLGLGNQDPALWVMRRRPGKGTLISKDTDGIPLKFSVSVCNDYTGPCPGVWDGSGQHWRPVKGDVSLLERQLGVELSCNDPNDFDVGAAGPGAGVFNSRKLRLVEWISPATPIQKVFLSVTCVIEGDQRATVFLPRRSASITRFQITAQVDAKDRYETELISKWSDESNSIGVAPDTFGRDDTHDAVDEAYARQAAMESAHLAGTLTIPRLSLAYSIGDRIPKIRGRNVNLQTNAGGAGGDPPTYAEVIGLDWHLVKQATVLSLSDARADHQSAI